MRLNLSSGPPADCRLPAVSAAGTPGDDDRQGNTVKEPEIADFDVWDDPDGRALTTPAALAVMRPVVVSMLREMATNGTKSNGKIVCPFTLMGLATMERRMGRMAWQPVAHACGFPMHPSCPRRSGERTVDCHKVGCASIAALYAHASTQKGIDDEDDDGSIAGQLHLHLSRWMADGPDPRRWDTSDSVGGI